MIDSYSMRQGGVMSPTRPCAQIPVGSLNERPWPSHLESAKWGTASPMGKKKE